MQKDIMLIRLILVAFAVLALPLAGHAATSLPEDNSTGIVLAYHRIGEDTYPYTNLRIGQFHEHLKLLSSAEYNVIPLPDLLSAIQSGERLPPKTLAITFEGAYKSAYENAMQPLIEREIPFTVFFSSNHADSYAAQHMNWRDLQSLSRHKIVSFGLLPASYTRLSDQSNEEILSQINKARVRFREKLKHEPKLFSYPFGEYSLAYKTLIIDQGFEAAFGLQSGALAPSSDMYALPRFSMTEIYGDIERLQMISNALPLPVSDIEPQDLYLSTNTPQLGFSVNKALVGDLADLSCYISGQERPTTEILGNRVELRAIEPIDESRTRINCTLPGPEHGGAAESWRWFSMLLVQKNTEIIDDAQP